jgi:cell division protein ZipA
MKMFLLGCLVLFVLVIITAAVTTKNARGQATRKRSRERKNPSSDAPQPALDDTENVNTASAEDDAALGLQVTTEVKPTVTWAPELKVKPVEEPEPPQLKFIVLHVMAPAGLYYSGYELLQALLANGLRYGKQKIFHRYEHKNGQGPLIFSLASVNQPGTFDLPNMGSFSCPGLTLFMALKKCQQPRQAFNIMLETAKQLADDLSGDVWDEERKPLTMDKVASLRTELDRYLEVTRITDLFVEA